METEKTERTERARAARNRTLRISAEERDTLRLRLLYPSAEPLTATGITNKILCADILAALEVLPKGFADLLIIDPPYNLTKDFHGLRFSKTSDEAYLAYVRTWFPGLMETLKPDGSVYMCGDWRSSPCVYQVMRDFTVVRNRITWQREKGRGAKANWKNVSEDIWFGTKGAAYYFNSAAVKQRRRVLAPYRVGGRPKDWEETPLGRFRLTSPGNFWDDIAVPYWSMPENTAHPAQKPEKLMAKLILASCPEDGLVFDPFLGSGTAAVAAKKLGRRYAGIEINEEYCLWAEKRLLAADAERSIQGYTDGVFWERNTWQQQSRRGPPAGGGGL
jgi:site-specific DNA-methyltransferase (adenine-specific)